jgi:predicted metalloprotease with PDZ domain
MTVAGRRSMFTLFVLLLGVCRTPAFAQAPIAYRVSVPAPEHHWMQVEVRFADAPPGTLQVMMSRTSPGRYSIHEFARNVYDVRIDDGAGAMLKTARPNPSEWDVSGHRGVVRVRYRVYGNTTDGTFVGIDSTHAHVNIPAALMWARGLEDRAVRITFDPPAGSGWRVATQLHPTEDPYTFTAGNLWYLIDSPVEIGGFTLRAFQVGRASFRIALHHGGTDREADLLAEDVKRLVQEEAAVFGELPAYEGGSYTFLADYLPSARSDGMEHRNSTFMTSPGALGVPDERANILGTVSHEFFHGWNVERIRPRSLEPFDLENASIAGELWLAEGFTQYYGTLILQRAGLATLDDAASTWGATLDTVIRSPARKYRSAEEMSRMALFVDGVAPADRGNRDSTFISYYTWGEAIALGLDLTLRERSAGAITLDHYMRALWTKFGRPGGAVEGVVDHPYTMQDARDCLADVSGDRAFANEFFDRYIQGRDVPDFAALLKNAGLLLRKRDAGRAWIGPLRVTVDRGSARVSAPTIEDTPVYAAGLDQGDEIVLFDGEPFGPGARVEEILERHKPGDVLTVSVQRPGGRRDLIVTTEEDPRLHLVPAESNGTLTPSARALREAWLKSQQ